MKKLFLMMGLASLFLVACNNNTPKQEQPKPQEEQQQEAVTEQHQCPFCALKAEYANWDDMEEVAKVDLNNKAIALFKEMDDKMAEGKGCCEQAGEKKEACEQKMAEMTDEQKAECEAKCKEMKDLMDKWANISAMTNDEVKDLVLARIAAMGMGEGKCGNHEGEGHQCQHEGEEGHECQHAK